MSKKRGFPFVQASADLKSKKRFIVDTWADLCREELWAARNVDRVTLRDSIPDFIDALVLQLAFEPEPHAESADEHGRDRATCGEYSLPDVINEYRLLRRVISETIDAEHKLDNDLTDFINEFIDRGISRAVATYLATEKREREAATYLQNQSQAQLNMALDNAKAGTWYLDIPKGHIYASKEVAKIYGLPGIEQEDIGEAIGRLVSAEDQELINAGIADAITNNSLFSVEFRIRRADGEIRWSSARGRVEYDASDNPLRLSGIQTDITDRMDILQDLKEAKIEADRANQAKSAFLANMSHEIRTPLGAIMGFSDLLKSTDLTIGDRTNFVSVIDRNAKHALRIIDDILDLSKVEAGKMLIEHVKFSLPEMLADFSSLMSLRAREKAISFELRIPSPIPDYVSSDPTRLRQILNNIVGNAIKFTERGLVQLTVDCDGNKLEFSVSDTGLGIASEQAQQLFRPFHQADATTTRRFGGTGLGLILTRRLTQAMGGEFILENSTPGRGSVFVASILVDLPDGHKLVDSRNLEFVSRPPAAPLVETEPLKGMTVLVVEDSVDNQLLLKLILSKVGARVEMANDGFEGVNKALAREYNVILMDVQMPRMDGYEATHELRSKGQKIPIIALTAHAMKEERERAITSGFDDFLSKPIQRDALIETLLKFKT